jgi:DUF1680 family protein
MEAPLKLCFAILLLFCIPLAAEDARPVLDTARSPKAVLHGVPVSAVTLGEGFWAPRRKVNVEVSLPTMLELFEQKGILDNFRRISGKKDVPRHGPLFTDSDIYKWLEAVAFTLQSGPQPKLRASAEAVIDDVVAAQEPSGYLNTYYSRENLAQRHQNMRGGHELYCLGHMLQAGIAWQRATGERKLLDSGIRMVEYLLRNFGPDKKPIFTGHPEFELALVELYRTTADRRYLDFAGYLLGGDPRNHIAPRDLAYMFSGRPFYTRTRLEGHAVRAMYASSGAADYYLETGDDRYFRTLETLWQDMVQHKMYLTGGVGSRASGEAFGEPYELPNQQAYTESCAAIGNIFWDWRMLQATASAPYMDVLERALYNGANSGLSLGGNLYCYRNPLELVGNPDDKIRNPWYDTTCCPPNLQRLLGSLPGYFYSTSKDGLYVHLYHNSELRWHLEDSSPLHVAQSTRYPWEGTVELRVEPAKPQEFTLFLRIPAWARKAEISVNGTPVSGVTAGVYFPLRRTWKPADRVLLRLDVTPRFTAANPRVRENLGKVAVERGPLVYCMEGIDQPSGAAMFDWAIDTTGKFESEWRSDLLGGVMLLRHKGTAAATPSATEALYRPFTPAAEMGKSGALTLIPYYTFANREPTPMQVWIPYR